MAIDEELELPRPFGPYTLVRRLAVGGMAEVYVAKTKGLGGFEKLVAIKVIHPRYSEDEHFVQMLVEEAKISVLLNHVNIAQTFDLGCIEDTYYIVMELIEGADAYRVMRRASERKRAIPIDLCAHIAAEVASGLDYAHRKRDAQGRPLGIVHRDVSPQNVLISFAGEVKIVDFGIAKAALRGGQTEAGVIKGKFYYMSPEQAWGDPMDHRSDIFSVGVVLYELLTGRMLYQEDNVPLLLDRVRKAEVARPETRRPSVPRALSDIVMKALARDASDRFQSAQEMAQALTRFLYATSPTFTAARLAEMMGTLFPQEVQRHSAIMSLPSIEEPVERATRESLSPEAHSQSVLFSLDEGADGEEPTRHDLLAFKRAQRAKALDSPAEAKRITARPARPRPEGATPLQVRAPVVGPSGSWVSPVAADLVTTSPRRPSEEATDHRPSSGQGWDDTTNVKGGGWQPGEDDDDDATLVDSAGIAAAIQASVRAPEGAAQALSARGKVNVQWSRPPTLDAAVTRPMPAQPAPPKPAESAAGRPPPPPAQPKPVAAPAPSPAAPPAFTMLDPFATAAPAWPPPASGPASAGPASGGPASSGLASSPPAPRRVIAAAVVVAVLVALAVIAFLSAPPPPAIEIISSPTGARVAIDGRGVPGVTPLTVRDGIERGRTYRVDVAMDGYESWSAQLSPTEGALRQFVVLAPLHATLRVETEPPGLDVMINGAARGRSPVEITGLQIGQEVEVRTARAGRAPIARRVRLAEGTTTLRLDAP